MRHAVRAKFFLVLVIAALVSLSVAFLMDNRGLKRPSKPARKEVRTDQAEVVIDGFHFANSKNNRENWELSAKKAEVKRDTGLTDLKDLEATFNGEDGNALRLKADEGTFDSNTKAIKLNSRDKDITITSSNGYRMSAKDLSWDGKGKQLKTDEKVRLSGKNIEIEGKGLVARSDLQEVRITNGVKTVFSQSR